MIRVNLLPQEYRKAEATPLKQFFATVGAVVVGTLAAVAWGWVHFVKVVPLRQERDTLIAEIKEQEKPGGQVEQTKKLDAKVKELQAQFKLIDEVAKNRVVWTRQLDQVWELVVNPKSPGRYEVWLDNIACATTTGGPAAKIGGTIQYSGTSAGAQMARMADFHEDISTGPFFADFQSMTPPFGNREKVGPPDRDPQDCWTFNFTMEMKPLKDVNEAHAKAAAEGAKK
jgi:Tfp pilus assembly protein PilN